MPGFPRPVPPRSLTAGGHGGHTLTLGSTGTAPAHFSGRPCEGRESAFLTSQGKFISGSWNLFKPLPGPGQPRKTQSRKSFLKEPNIQPLRNLVVSPLRILDPGCAQGTKPGMDQVNLLSWCEHPRCQAAGPLAWKSRGCTGALSHGQGNGMVGKDGNSRGHSPSPLPGVPVGGSEHVTSDP